MSEQQNNSPRQAAVNALISWAKTGWGYYSMRDAVDNYLESVSYTHLTLPTICSV